MQQHQRRLTVQTPGKGLIDITAQVMIAVRESGIDTGLLTLFVRHTSASLIIQENADPNVLRDLEAYLGALVPEVEHGGLSNRAPQRRYLHDDEGPDDMPAHIRTALTCTSLSLSFDRGRLLLGTWQAVYLWEHRARPQQRQLSLHLIGS